MSDVNQRTRRDVLLGLGTAGAATLAGCAGGAGGGGGPTETDAEDPTDSPDSTPASASVRVIHASPNAPEVDVYVDGSRVLGGVAYGAVSEYLALPGGTYPVAITAAGDPETVVFEGDVTVSDGTAYTVVAAGELGDMADRPFGPVVLTDDTTDPGDDTAAVRLLHASPDAPAVDVTLADGGDVLFDGVAYGESGTVEVPAGEYTIDVRGDTEGNDGDVVASFDLSLDGGETYTGFAVGYLTPDDEPADTLFDLVVSHDSAGD